MWSKKLKLIAAGCLCVSALSGIVGAQVMLAQQRRHLNTGLFISNPRETILFHLSLDDQRSQPGARVRLQLVDENGVVVAHDETTIDAGQTVTLRAPGGTPVRAHGELIEGVFAFTSRRAVVGSVEVFDQLTGVVRPICSFDPAGLPGGRN
jgi:hypothetical protein